MLKITEIRLKSAVKQLDYTKNTGAWKGRLKRFFVDPSTVELAKKFIQVSYTGQKQMTELMTEFVNRGPTNLRFVFSR